MATSPPSRRVLLVDDDATFREALARALRRRSVAAVTARDTAAAREALDPAIDAALVDLRLGSENGLDVARDILARCPGARVVITSGTAHVLRAACADEARIAGTLLKPFDADQLLEAWFPGSTKGGA